MRIFVMPAGEETGLLVMAHHLAGDGKSMVYFLEDIMRALSGEKLVFKLMNLITNDMFPPHSRLPESVWIITMLPICLLKITQRLSIRRYIGSLTIGLRNAYFLSFYE